MNICKRCGGQGIPSKAIISIHNIEFPLDGSKSEFEVRLIDCIKCKECGHSWTEGKQKVKSVSDYQQEFETKLLDYSPEMRERLFAFMLGTIKYS